MSEIHSLIDRLQAAAASPQNRSRGQRRPMVAFGLEEPICWTILYGYDANRYFSDPEFYFAQTLRQKLWRWEHFPDDAQPLTAELPAWLGHYPEYTFIGLEVAFTPRGVPRIQSDHPISGDPDLRHLQPVDFLTSGWMPRVLRWYEALQRLAAGRLPVRFNMVWWRGCLDLAIQLRGYEQFLLDIRERPQFVHDLLRWLTEQRCRWYEAYYHYFGLEVQPAPVADDWVNVPFIAPALFADFVLPRYLEIEAFHGGLSSFHSCGNQAPVQKYLLQIESLSGFEVSPWTDLLQTLGNVPADKSLAIVLHPNEVLCATPSEMEARFRCIMESCRGRSYGIFTSGLTPLSADPAEFISKIRTWTEVAQQVKNDPALSLREW